MFWTFIKENTSAKHQAYGLFIANVRKSIILIKTRAVPQNTKLTSIANVQRFGS